MIKTVIAIDENMRDRLKPVLERNGQTFASFVRTSMADAVERYEAVQAGRTQVDPRVGGVR